jgi:Putative Ig domain
MQKLCLLGALLAALGACSGGSSASGTAASTNANSISLQGVPPDTVTVGGLYATTGNTSPSGSAAPSIGGTPAGAVIVERAYSFTPTAADAGGDALTFSVQNAPSWASFNSGTGELSGTPTLADVGTFSKIILSVSDGTRSASLPQFSIAVSESAQGNATLTWVPPTQNTDGTALTNLAGYRIYYGSRANALTQTIQIDNPGTTDYVVSNLTAGTWYFAITAVSSTHAESAESTVENSAVM